MLHQCGTPVWLCPQPASMLDGPRLVDSVRHVVSSVLHWWSGLVLVPVCVAILVRRVHLPATYCQETLQAFQELAYGVTSQCQTLRKRMQGELQQKADMISYYFFEERLPPTSGVRKDAEAVRRFNSDAWRSGVAHSHCHPFSGGLKFVSRLLFDWWQFCQFDEQHSTPRLPCPETSSSAVFVGLFCCAAFDSSLWRQEDGGSDASRRSTLTEAVDLPEIEPQALMLWSTLNAVVSVIAGHRPTFDEDGEDFAADQSGKQTQRGVTLKQKQPHKDCFVNDSCALFSSFTRLCERDILKLTPWHWPHTGTAVLKLQSTARLSKQCSASAFSERQRNGGRGVVKIG
eukprot:713006-Amphidinium_carterae.2